MNISVNDSDERAIWSPPGKQPVDRPANRPSLVAAFAAGALAMGAIAIGALAIGSLAIGRMAIGRGELRDLRIGRLTVGDVMLGRSGERASERAR